MNAFSYGQIMRTCEQWNFKIPNHLCSFDVADFKKVNTSHVCVSSLRIEMVFFVTIDCLASGCLMWIQFSLQQLFQKTIATPKQSHAEGSCDLRGLQPEGAWDSSKLDSEHMVC